MKALIIQLLTSAVFLLTHNSSISQSFQGKLTYVFENIEMSETLKQNMYNAFSKNTFEEDNGALLIFTIKHNRLLAEDFNIKGEVNYQYFQKGQDAYLVFSESHIKDYFEDPGKKYDNLKLIKRGKKTKEILGLKCRQYEYLHPDQRTKVVAWIAEDFPFNEKEQRHKYFSTVFFPQGLVVVRDVIFKHGTNRWSLKKIEIYEVPDHTFNFFFTKDK